MSSASQRSISIACALRRHDFDRRHQGSRPQHRLRPEAGDRSGCSVVRPQRRSEVVRAELLGRRQTPRRRRRRCALGLRPQVPSGFRPLDQDSNEVAARISAIDLNRDDKAHSFVVSLNAFQDGNRLAYLALAIAIGIDSLIFMSGLSAPMLSARRSPTCEPQGPQLAAVERHDRDGAPARYLPQGAPRRASMHPIDNTDGYSNEVRLNELDAETANEVRSVLNAGAIIGAVKPSTSRYLVRSELLEFLNVVIKQNSSAWRGRPPWPRTRPTRRPDDGRPSPRSGRQLRSRHAGVLAHRRAGGLHLRSLHRRSSEDVRPPMLNVLNAAATFQVVQRDKSEADRYYIHKDLYKVLSRIRAPASWRAASLHGREALPARFGGEARAAPPRLWPQSPSVRRSPTPQPLPRKFPRLKRSQTCAATTWPLFSKRWASTPRHSSS